MSQQTWQLPLIVNDSLKQKLQSISAYHSSQPSLRRSPTNKRNKSKDLFSCLHKNPTRNIFQQSLPVSKQINAMISIANTMTNLNKVKKNTKKRFKSKFFFTPIPLSRPQGSTISAFVELQRYLITYFKEHNETYLREETAQLKNLTKKGASLLKNTLDEFKHRDKVFLDPFINLLFHQISSQVTIVQNGADTIYHLARVEYYALKCNLLQFAAYCLAEQAGIHRQTADMDLAFSCLRKGLIIAVHAGDQEAIHSMLQKIGIFYYYSGNTAIGGHYHRLAERGLNNAEAEVYKLELKIERYVKSLEEKLFNVDRNSIAESQKEELISPDESLQIEMEQLERQESQQKAMVSKMLKNSGLRKIGQRMRYHMSQTLSLASIISHSHSPSPNQKSKQNLPRINASHVLKSHLSKNRMPGPGPRDWQLYRLMQLVELLPQ